MKLAITAAGADLQAPLDPRFGRAQYYIFIDVETMNFEVVDNSKMNPAHGAGIQAAQLMSEREVEAVITGNVGPNAFQALTAANIQMFQMKGSNVSDAIETFKAGKLQPISQMGPAHAGMGSQGNAKGKGRGRNR
ncbi:MAG: NifB/NifX family molybdenum-iron cluster-binding protein [bacterium]|nr:NifB/NifX family molybdenum-iron cluster-binding protein [bacterium]